jgi:hypothetical protein
VRHATLRQIADHVDEFFPASAGDLRQIAAETRSLEEQLEASQRKLAREQARKRLYKDAVRDVRLAMLGENVDIMWSNGQFWIDELARILADTASSPASEPEAS